MHHFKLNQAITQNRGSAALNLVLSKKKTTMPWINTQMKWKQKWVFTSKQVFTDLKHAFRNATEHSYIKTCITNIKINK